MSTLKLAPFLAVLALSACASIPRNDPSAILHEAARDGCSPPVLISVDAAGGIKLVCPLAEEK